MIEAARTYQPLFEDLRKHLPTHYQCIYAQNIGSSQEELLHYHAKIRLQTQATAKPADCDLYLIEDQPGKRHVLPGDEWRVIWEGEQTRQNRESFRLLQRNHK